MRGAFVVGLMVAAVGTAWPARTDAQTLGTFKWQLAPYCNVVTVTITQQGGVYALDGTDDQCGASRTAAADGTAFLNPDGTVGFGFSIVPAPSGVPVTVDASIDPGTLSGAWRDSAGNSGTFAFAPGGSTGGPPRPLGTAVAGVQVGHGLSYTQAAGTPSLAIDGAAIARLVRVTQPGTNFAVGDRAMRAPASDAYGNLAFGDSALTDLTAGDFNTAIGIEAARSLQDGVGNVALGWRSLSANISGHYNVALGIGALERIKVSRGNTAIGPGALFYLQLGNNNIGIGENAGFGTVAGSFNIYIGANGVNLDNYTTRIGSTQQQRAFIGGIRGVQTGIANGVPVVIDSSGQLGTVNSSRRFKQDIADLGAAADAVLKLRPVQFRYTTPYADGATPLHYGLIAEEVAEVLPELVARSADGTIETVHYQTLPTLLLAQVQRLERERAALAERLAALEQEMAGLRVRAGHGGQR